MTYYNTTNMNGSTLKEYREKAQTQEERILTHFKREKPLPWSPSEILSVVFSDNPPPITSIRRSMTNLTKAGELEKTDEQVMGAYGRPEYLWKLAAKYSEIY